MGIDHSHCSTTRSKAWHQIVDFTHHQGHAGVRDNMCRICQEEFKPDTPTLVHVQCGVCFCESCITESVDQYERERCPWCSAQTEVPAKVKAKRAAAQSQIQERIRLGVAENQMLQQQQRHEQGGWQGAVLQGPPGPRYRAISLVQDLLGTLITILLGLVLLLVDWVLQKLNHWLEERIYEHSGVHCHPFILPDPHVLAGGFAICLAGYGAGTCIIYLAAKACSRWQTRPRGV